MGTSTVTRYAYPNYSKSGFLEDYRAVDGNIYVYTGDAIVTAGYSGYYAYTTSSSDTTSARPYMFFNIPAAMPDLTAHNQIVSVEFRVMFAEAFIDVWFSGFYVYFYAFTLGDTLTDADWFSGTGNYSPNYALTTVFTVPDTTTVFSLPFTNTQWSNMLNLNPAVVSGYTGMWMQPSAADLDASYFTIRPVTTRQNARRAVPLRSPTSIYIQPHLAITYTVPSGTIVNRDPSANLNPTTPQKFINPASSSTYKVGTPTYTSV